MLFVAWLYRQVFECCRRVDRILFSQKAKVESVHVSELPWMWVGAMYSDCNVVDYTAVVNESVQYGVNIDYDWLQAVTLIPEEVTWLYLDPKSLEQKEFPSQGFVIYPSNDTFSDSSEDKNHPASSHGSDSE